MKNKLKLTIEPKKYNAPDTRKELYDAVDIISNTDESPCVGYAIVSFHENGNFRAYWKSPPGCSAMDMPEMAKARIQALMIKNLT